MTSALLLERVSLPQASDLSFSLEVGHCLALIGERDSGIHSVRKLLTGALPLVSGDFMLGDSRYSAASSRERKRMLAAVRVISSPLGLTQLLQSVDEAVAHAADIVVLDEPLLHLHGVQAARALAALRKAITGSALGWLLITSDVSVVEALASTVVVMYESDVVESGSVAHVVHGAQHPYTQALISAVPQLDPISQAERDLVILQSAAETPMRGCILVGRCPFAHLQCEQLVPELLADEVGHSVACHYPQPRNVIISTTRRPHSLRPMPAGSSAHDYVRPDFSGPISGRDFVSD